MRDPDGKLVKKAKSGNLNSFNKLVKKYQERILYLSYDLLGNYEDAKDVAQEAFIRAFEKFNQFEERSRFSTWLYRITVNLAIDLHRKNKKCVNESIGDIDFTGAEIELQSSVSSNPDTPEFLLESKELTKHIENVLVQLSINQRSVIVLKYFHQNSTKEIAEIMQCSENTVRVHIFRGLEKLKKYLTEYQ